MKKLLIILVVIIVLLAIVYFYQSYKINQMKKQAENIPNAPGSNVTDTFIHEPGDYLKEDQNLKAIFENIKNTYGKDIAVNVEKIMRLESGHFSSAQYKNTGSAGMLAFADTYPYGWTSLKEFWDKNPRIKPTGIGYTFGKYKYLAFPNYGGFYSLAEILKRRNNNAGSWYSTEPEQQAEYIAKLNTIKTQFV